MTIDLLGLYLRSVADSALSDGTPEASADATASLRRYRLAIAEKRRAKELWRLRRIAGVTSQPWLTPL